MRTELIKKAIEKYGEAAQYIQTAEEVGEFLTAISQYRRGRCGKEQVVEEMTDVLIMFDCLKQLMNISEDELATAIEQKYSKFNKQVNS